METYACAAGEAQGVEGEPRVGGGSLPEGEPATARLRLFWAPFTGTLGPVRGGLPML